MPSFDEVRFPSDISEQSSGGPGFATTVTVSWSGRERRISTRQQSRMMWNAAHGVRDQDQAEVLIAFFYARQGKARGFRWQDPLDFEIADSPIVVTGLPTVQLIKRYTSGGVTFDRIIKKPVIADVPEPGGYVPTFELNGDPYEPASLDETTGIVTLNVDNQKTISAATMGSTTLVNGAVWPHPLTLVDVGTGHGFDIDQWVYLAGLNGGNHPLNGHAYKILPSSGFNVVGASVLTLDFDSTGYPAWTSGGTVTRYDAQPSDELTWSGQFDVPARFDTDTMGMGAQDAVRNWNNIPIIEIFQ